MKQKIIELFKVLVFLFVVFCVGSFVYYSISVSFPVFKMDTKPTVTIIFTIDEKNIIKPGIHIPGFNLYNKFGPQSVLNPIYSLAKFLFYKPTQFMLCLDYADGNVPFQGSTSHDWATQHGWTYRIYTQEENEVIADFPKDRIINEALVVEGECAEDYDDNKSITKYDVHYTVAGLDSFYSSPLMNLTFNQALNEAHIRIEFDAGYTQLSAAIRENCLECVKSILSKGVNPNGPVSAGKTIPDSKLKTIKHLIPPLRLAMQKDRYEIFVYLLSQGARDKLSFSAKKDRIDYFSLQIKAGNNINEKDRHGRTALETSIIFQCFECVKLLVSRGVIINALYRNHTPLSMALQRNNFEITKYLLDQGAKKDFPRGGWTAYDILNRGDIVKDKRIIELFSD